MVKLDELELLRDGVVTLNVEYSELQLEKLLNYKELLVKWNKVYSLTAITKSREIIIQHLLDGLSVINNFPLHGSILDVGSGMGVPGVILAIMRPEQNVVVIDSNTKKCAFLLQVKIELQLVNLTVISKRVEDYKPEDKFQVITSRAFADLTLFVQLTEHLLADNGLYLAMKGEQGVLELVKLNNWLGQVIELSVPNLVAQRFLIKMVRK